MPPSNSVVFLYAKKSPWNNPGALAIYKAFRIYQGYLQEI